MPDVLAAISTNAAWLSEKLVGRRARHGAHVHAVSGGDGDGLAQVQLVLPLLQLEREALEQADERDLGLCARPLLKCRSPTACTATWVDYHTSQLLGSMLMRQLL